MLLRYITVVSFNMWIKMVVELNLEWIDVFLPFDWKQTYSESHTA